MNKQEFYKLLEQYYRNNYRTLIKKLQRSARSRHNAEDIVQDAFTRAFQYWKSFNVSEEKSLEKWFNGILRNSFNQYRIKNILHGMFVELNEGMLFFHKPSAYFNLIIKEIEGLINKKKSEEIFILRLFFLLQYKPADIAKVSPKSNEAIRQVIYRFRQELKEVYGKKI